jgi:hypothetical protein
MPPQGRRVICEVSAAAFVCHEFEKVMKPVRTVRQTSGNHASSKISLEQTADSHSVNALIRFLTPSKNLLLTFTLEGS